MTLDELRVAYPELGFAIYALEPGKKITFEVHTPDGDVFTWRGSTEAETITEAFPPPPPESIFD